MGDFYQKSTITTLHNFKMRPLENIENELLEFSKSRPIGLIIPTIYSELDRPALSTIVNTLKDIPYIGEIIIGLDSATKDEFKRAKEFFSVLPQHHRVIWNDGPGMRHLEYLLSEAKIHTGNRSKGKNVWYCFGYMIASGKSEAIALHDADILTYERDMLARLIYPVANPMFNFKFSKGFYFRADNEKMNGRMVRLLITPFLRSLDKILGQHDYIDYLDSFRYILSSEVAMRSDVIKTAKVSSDLSFEFGILNEVLRNNNQRRICQVEIIDRHDHNHQAESFDNPEKGLSKMSLDIARAIYSRLAADGFEFNEGLFRTIKATYLNLATDLVDQYHNDAVMNGLYFNRIKEERLVDQFSKNIYQAGINYLNNPNQVPIIQSWKQVLGELPDLKKTYLDIIEEDNLH